MSPHTVSRCVVASSSSLRLKLRCLLNNVDVRVQIYPLPDLSMLCNQKAVYELYAVKLRLLRRREGAYVRK